MQLLRSDLILYLPPQPLPAQCMSMWSPVISCHLSARPLKWPLRMKTRLWALPIHTHSRSRLFLHIAVRQIPPPPNMFFVFKLVWLTSENFFALYMGLFLCTLVCDCYQHKDFPSKMTMRSRVGFLLGVCFVLPFIHYIQMLIYILTVSSL